MFEPIRKIFKSKKGKWRALMPDGQRAYVIGDIHGRCDLFEALAKAIEDDNAEAGNADSVVILLGDLVDRGPDSAGVVKFARKWQAKRNVRCLVGNHEEMFLDSFKDTGVLRHFIKHGGRETILSYGVPRKKYNDADMEELQLLMREYIPKKDRSFIKSFEEMIEIGDYLFVHAGIDPERPLAEQRKRDTRWIRDRFLDHKEPHSHMVVHCHTIFEEIDERHNRIGIDTGAYRFGKLTALVLEGNTKRYIQAIEKKSGKIVIEKKEKAA